MSKSQCVWKLHSACINHTRASRYYTCECQYYTHTCQNYSRMSENHTLRVKSLSACGRRSLRNENNLVRVEITLVHVGSTFVPVKITLRVEIILCVWESHSSVSRNQSRECQIHTHTSQTYSTNLLCV
jgi:hypothetical protein